MTLQCAAGGSYIPPLPIDTFRIELEEGPKFWFKPGDEVKGKILLKAYDDFYCLGIRVALEGSVVVSYLSGKAVRTKIENLLPDPWTTVYFIGKDLSALADRSQSQKYWVRKNLYEFEFTIPIRKLNPFPGTFKGPSGEIVYRVAAYLETGFVASSKAVQRGIKIQSYLNLRSMPTTLKPAVLEGQESKSLFSSSNGIMFSLTLPRTGYLSGEEIPFKLKLINPSGGKSISRVLVALLRKIGFKSDVSTKKTKNTLAFFEIAEEKLLDGKTTEVANCITIPDDVTYPSFTGLIVHYNYFVKVEIFLNGNETAGIFGETPITIGTVREIQQRMSPDEGPMARSLSMISLSSTTDSIVSRPPSYSALSSRRSSVETLPPLYEDAIAFEVCKMQLEDK